MSKHLKVMALLAFGLAMLFFLFFQTSKHDATLVGVNAFADDPYDAVGSFGIQAALFFALLALVRAFRFYAPNTSIDIQKRLLLRADILACASIGITMLADSVALIRHPQFWLGKPAGTELAVLTGGLLLLALLVSWPLLRWLYALSEPASRRLWIRALGSFLVGIGILTFYPEEWRQRLPGELLTIFTGMSFLFVLLWAIGSAISPSPETLFEDVLDDFQAVYRWLKAHSSPFVVCANLLERPLSWPIGRTLLRWLNPRLHRWNLPLLLGCLVGALYMLLEVLGSEGGPSRLGLFLLLGAIFIGGEAIAVLMGYLLLSRPLGLFRRTAAVQSIPTLPG